MEVVVVENEASDPAKSPGAAWLRWRPCCCCGRYRQASAQDQTAAARHLAGREFQRQAAGRSCLPRDCTGAGCHKGPQGLGRGRFPAASRASCASTTPTAAKVPRRWPAIFRISRGRAGTPRSRARRAAGKPAATATAPRVCPAELGEGGAESKPAPNEVRPPRPNPGGRTSRAAARPDEDPAATPPAPPVAAPPAADPPAARASAVVSRPRQPRRRLRRPRRSQRRRPRHRPRRHHRSSTSSTTLDLITNTDPAKAVAWLAIEPADAPWPPLPGKTASAGPFYIVWIGAAASTIRSEQWPYQVASPTARAQRGRQPAATAAVPMLPPPVPEAAPAPPPSPPPPPAPKEYDIFD